MPLPDLSVLFGSPAGRIAGETHDREQAEALARIAMDNAHTRLFSAQAAEKEIEAADAQWMQTAGQEFTQLMSDAGLKADPEEQALAMGQASLGLASAAYAAGRPALATKWGKIGADTVSVARQAQLRKERTAGEQQKQAYEMLDRIGGIAGSVTDQASWDSQRMLAQANPQWGIDLSGLPDRFEEARPVLDALARGTVKMKDNLDLRVKRDELKRKEEADAERERHNKRIEGILDRNAKTREDAEKRRAKYGGKPVGVPSGEGIFQAGKLLDKYAEENGLQIVREDRALMASSIASRAAAIMKSVQGIDLGGATLRAIQEAKEEKDFSVNEGVLSILPDWAVSAVGKVGAKPDLKFEGRGKSAASPVPLPPSAEALVKGKWYETPAGVGQWNGVDFDLEEEEEGD